MNEPKTVAPQRHRLLTETEIVAASEARGPIKCGIYFLIKDGELKYVGKSINIEARLGAHRPRGFDRWHWIPCLPEELDHLERRYIDEFLPPSNSDPLTAKKAWRSYDAGERAAVTYASPGRNRPGLACRQQQPRRGRS